MGLGFSTPINQVKRIAQELQNSGRANKAVIGINPIVYGTAAQESVPRLYAAGVLPGLLIAAMIAAYVVWYAKRHNFERGHAFSLNHFGKAFVRGIWALGNAGVEVPMKIYREGRTMELKVPSADRRRFLKAPRLH